MIKQPKTLRQEKSQGFKIPPKMLSYQSTYSILGKLFVRPAKILAKNFARATDKLEMTKCPTFH
jgi:hypothetical protein